MSARRASSRTGFVVVLVILVVSVGLLLSSVSRVREAPARAVCANHLKQFGFAVQLYNDVHGHFPPGTVSGTDLPPDRRLSVFAVLLPYVEEDAIYKRLALAERWDSERNVAAVVGHPVRVFHCPSGRPEGDGLFAVTYYVGIAGLGPDAATLPDDDPRIGIMGYDRKLKPDRVKDGLANTALFAETTREPGPWARGGPSTVRGVDPADRPLTGPGRPFGGLHRRDTSFFWQDEHLGSNVGLADGSVRYLRDDIDPAVWAALATASGGEPLPDW